MKALIDGDIILYSVGFASENRHYKCSDGHLAKSAKDAKEHCILMTEFAADDAEPMSYELQKSKVKPHVWKGNANNMIKSILKAAGTDDYIIYLTGKGNYRSDMYPEYKANRKDVAKPLHFQEIKDYLLDTQPCEVINGEEADDAMGIAQALAPTDTTIICSLDKDMDMIAGKHYNWGKHTVYTVKQEDGDRWFWTQLLTGDMTDNIIGLKGIGPVKAIAALDAADIQDNAGYYKVCQTLYKVKERSMEDLELNGHLLWIKRHPTSTWKDLLNE
jgi:5'-3' exonuclease